MPWGIRKPRVYWLGSIHLLDYIYIYTVYVISPVSRLPNRPHLQCRRPKSHPRRQSRHDSTPRWPALLPTRSRWNHQTDWAHRPGTVTPISFDFFAMWHLGTQVKSSGSFDHLTSPLTWQSSSMCTSSDSVHTWFNMYDLKWSQVIQAIFKNKFHNMSTYNRKSIQSYPVISSLSRLWLQATKRETLGTSEKRQVFHHRSWPQAGACTSAARLAFSELWSCANKISWIIMNWWIMWPIWHNMNILYIYI